MSRTRIIKIGEIFESADGWYSVTGPRDDLRDRYPIVEWDYSEEQGELVQSDRVDTKATEDILKDLSHMYGKAYDRIEIDD